MSEAARIPPDLAQRVDVRLLPYGLRRIIETIGFDATYRLLSKRGGTRIRCNRNDRTVRVVADIIGAELSRKLMSVLTANRSAKLLDENPVITLPKIDKLMTQLRDEAIFNSSETDAEVAMRFNISERWASKIRLGQSRKRNTGSPMPQRDLFDAA